MSTEQTPGGPTAPPPGQPSGQQHPGRAGADFFGWIRRLGVTRGQDRWAGGVASGLAHRWGVDPVLIRGLFIVAAIFLGVGVLAYGVLWLLLPEPDGRIHVQEAMRGRWTAGMTGGLAATILGLGGARAGFWFGDARGAGPFWGLFWLAAVALVIFSVSRSRRRRRQGWQRGWYGSAPGHQAPQGGADATATSDAAGAAKGGTAHDDDTDYGRPTAGAPYSSTPHASGPYTSEQYAAGPHPAGGPYTASPYASSAYAGGPYGYTPAPSRPHPVRQHRRGPGGPFAAVVVGVAVLVAGGLLALQLAGVAIVDPSTGALWAIGAGILGLGIVVAGLRGRSGGILSFLAVIALLAAAVTQPAFEVARPRNAVNLAPSSIQQAVSGYHITAASGDLDLRALDTSGPLTADATVPVDATMSQLQIRIPKDVPVRVDADATMGNVRFGDHSIAGMGARGSETYNAGRPGAKLVVTVHATMSNVDIQQEQ